MEPAVVHVPQCTYIETQENWMVRRNCRVETRQRRKLTDVPQGNLVIHEPREEEVIFFQRQRTFTPSRKRAYL